MAKPRDNNPVAFAGLLIAAAVLAVSIYLNYSHSPSSLILAESGDALAVETAGPIVEAVASESR